MTGLLARDAVEDRLRRALAAHAQDMADGDGDDPAPDMDPAPLLLDAPVEIVGRRPAKRALVAAFAAVVIGGIAVAVLPRGFGSGSENAVPATGTVERCMPWTDPWRAGSDGTTLWAVDDHDPNRANIAALVATEPADPDLAHQIDAEQRSAGWFEPRASDDRVTIGQRTGWYRPVPGSEGRVAFLHFGYDELTVTILAMQVSKADMIAFAESLQRDPDGSWRYAVPPGFESHCPSS